MSVAAYPSETNIQVYTKILIAPRECEILRTFVFHDKFEKKNCQNSVAMVKSMLTNTSEKEVAKFSVHEKNTYNFNSFEVIQLVSGGGGLKALRFEQG